MGKYRIIEGIYRDEYGNESHKVYYIKIKKKFLGISYWKYQTHLECGYGDCYDVNTEFKSHSDAYDFIQKNLCGKDFKDGWKYKVINEFDCNK